MTRLFKPCMVWFHQQEWVVVRNPTMPVDAVAEWWCITYIRCFDHSFHSTCLITCDPRFHSRRHSGTGAINGTVQKRMGIISINSNCFGMKRTYKGATPSSCQICHHAHHIIMYVTKKIRLGPNLELHRWAADTSHASRHIYNKTSRKS